MVDSVMPGGLLDRPLPYNVEAEKSVLGSLLVDRDAIIQIAPFLRPPDFYSEAHGVVYEAMLELYTRREPGDLVTLVDELKRNNRLDFIGGAAYLTELPAEAPTSVHVEYYARIVSEMATYRRLIDAGGRIASLGYQINEEVSKVVADAEQMLFAVTQQHTLQDFVPVGTVLDTVFDTLHERELHRGEVIGVPTGFLDIDELTGGLQPSDLIVVACRPSIGKTSFCLSMAHNTATKHGKRVGVFSLEMSKEQLALRLLAMETGVDTHSIRNGYLNDEQRQALTRAFGDLALAPIYIDDTPGLTAAEIRAKARRLQASVGVDMIIIDYLQLMQGRRSGGDSNRVQEVSEMSRGLKLLARELNIPVVAAAQLSRGVESRQSHIPMLSDLRESGSIEQDADIVMFIYREEVYDPDTEKKGIAEIHIAKHRNGPTGIARMLFQKETTRFVDLEENYSEPS